VKFLSHLKKEELLCGTKEYIKADNKITLSTWELVGGNLSFHSTPNTGTPATAQKSTGFGEATSSKDPDV